MDKAQYLPLSARQFVPSMKYSAEVSEEGLMTVDPTDTPAAASATAIMNAVAAGNSVATTTRYTNSQNIADWKYGRCVQIVAGGASTRTVTIRGRDYLGQYMSETLTLNGTNAVLGNKAFKKVDSVTTNSAAGTETVSVGWSSGLGLPFKALALINELVSKAAPTAGALVVGVDTQTDTSNDPRGRYTPHASFVPNGSRTYSLTLRVDKDLLEGAAQYYA